MTTPTPDPRDNRVYAVTVTVECPCCRTLIDLDIGPAMDQEAHYNRTWLWMDKERQHD